MTDQPQTQPAARAGKPRNRDCAAFYPRFRQLGYDCGSGPTESQCGKLTERLKGPGMRWDKSNAEVMMALAYIYHSDLWSTYWNAQRQAT
jgi:hypothetical protein